MTVHLERTTSVSNEGIIRKSSKEKKGKAKMEARKKKAMTRTTRTMKATMKGMKMRARVEKHRPHIYNPDFCQVMVQPRRRILVPPGQRSTKLTPYCPKRTGVLKFWRIAFFKGSRLDLLL